MKKKAVKLLSILLAAALLIGASVGGTLAWLSAKSETVTNTFTVGNINIKLEETKGDDDADLLNNSYKMVPGATIDKDPKVTVLNNSEACYLFVEVKESASLDTFITYEMAVGWEPVTGETDVYWRTHAAVDAGDTLEGISVLKGDAVTVKNTVTKEHMDNLKAGTLAAPTLTFTAYAVQSDNLTAAEGKTIDQTAWNIAKTEAVASTNP